MRAIGAARPWAGLWTRCFSGLAAARLGAVLVIAPAVAHAEIPREFLGKWTSRPGHCEPRNGEVDVLEVTPSGLAVYEVGCDLGRSERISGGMRFVAQCYKGGSPVSAGTVTLRRLGQGGIEFALLGFSWASDEAQRFSRCRTGRAR